MGVANERSIAWGISQKLSEAGAELAFTYLGDALKKRVVPLAEKLNSNVTFSCDVEKKEDVIKLFEDIKTQWGEIDFVVHAIAFSDKSEKDKKRRLKRIKKSTGYIAVTEALDDKDLKQINKLIRDVVGDILRDIWLKRNTWK